MHGKSGGSKSTANNTWANNVVSTNNQSQNVEDMFNMIDEVQTGETKVKSRKQGFNNTQQIKTQNFLSGSTQLDTTNQNHGLRTGSGH